MNILVTGATGFVGKELVRVLIEQEHQVSALVRQLTPSLPDHVNQIEVGDLASYILSDSHELSGDAMMSGDAGPQLLSKNKFVLALKGIDAVVHLAARVHIMSDKAGDPLAEFRKTNTELTLNLARKTAMAGVKRFIFLSTIKVNGESTTSRLPFSEECDHRATDPYAISKMEAEIGLVEIVKETGMEVVIIRPPLIYGPGVKGNFSKMLRLVSKGIPLPFGSIENKRSLLAVDNLVSFIICCLVHPKAANEIFLLADGEDVSTTQLIKKLAKAMGKRARLVSIPVSLMVFVAGLVGKKYAVDRLLGSLQVDSNKACKSINWSPVVTMDEQLRKMIDGVD